MRLLSFDHAAQLDEHGKVWIALSAIEMLNPEILHGA